MSISLILTCYNEKENIGVLIQDILNQTQLPDEMVIVDAGSKDGTIEVLHGFVTRFTEAGSHLRIIICDGASIAHGRNLAIESAHYDNIAVTDAGCRIQSDWLEKITRPLTLNNADFVGGFFLPVAPTRFQQILAALTTGSVPGNGFLPSSRSVAFRKSVWKKAGRYPEWLKWGEDTLFNKRCLAIGARYEVASEAIVHWEVRRTLGQVVKQFRRYAYGDGLAHRFTLSLAAGPLLYTMVLILLLAGYVLPLLLIPLFGASWAVRKKNIASMDLPYAVFLACSIQWARTIGYTYGVLYSFF